MRKETGSRKKAEEISDLVREQCCWLVKENEGAKMAVNHFVDVMCRDRSYQWWSEQEDRPLAWWLRKIERYWRLQTAIGTAGIL